LVERRKKWKGKRYTEPQAPDVEGLPDIPSNWSWVRLDTLAAIQGGITKDSKRKYESAREVPYLRVANVQRGYLDLSEIKEIEVSESMIEQLLLKRGDVLFTEGGDRDKLGRGWIWNGEIAECIHQNHVFRARPYSAEIQGKLISWFGNTFGQSWFMRQGKQTTNLASINLTKLSAFPIPLPPKEEQSFIVGEVERRLSVVDKLEATVEVNLKQATAMRQSILRQAFSGQLVPQDPDDEPADLLLKRINEEKEQRQVKGKRRSNSHQKESNAKAQARLF
jgi:type I restriction enzyme, S subunit